MTKQGMIMPWLLFLLLSASICQMVNGQPSFQWQSEESPPIPKSKEATPREILLYPAITETTTEEHIRDGEGNLIVAKVSNPSLALFLPSDSNKNRAAVIICPGGGYSNLHIQREGFRIAEAFNRKGVAAVVLKYRLPDRDIVEEGTFAPLRDAQRAIQMTRENAEQWGIDPNKVGIMGFSAGGHLASTAGVHHDTVLVENRLSLSLRPDFMILVYPVISFEDKVGHAGSKSRLVGEHPDEKLVSFFSNELHVNDDTPPCILFHANDDTIVTVENSILFYNKLRQYDVPAELHVYSKGEHGFLTTPPFLEWFNTTIQWMENEHFH